MSDLLNYKGYTGNVEFSDNCLHGRVLGIKGLLSYEGQTIDEVTEDFKSAVDEYLDMCNRDGIEPQKPFKGSFNVRANPELHKKLAIQATEAGMSLNKYIVNSLRKVAMF